MRRAVLKKPDRISTVGRFIFMAERVGFEPTVELLTLHSLSRRANKLHNIL
jgi:hypothetical protein